MPFRDARWTVHPFGMWEDPADDRRCVQWVEDVRAALRPWSTGAVCLNLVGDEGVDRVVAGLGAGNIRRLAAVKATYDPDNVFRFNHNILPRERAARPRTCLRRPPRGSVRCMDSRLDSHLDSRYDTQGAGITVQRALELPGLRSGLPEILAGADRLGRTVRWVHAGEVPNIASLLKGGELLLTTGYGLGTRPADQRAFVRTLAEARYRGTRRGTRPALHPAALGPRGDGLLRRSPAGPAAPRGALRGGHGGDPHRDRQRPLRAAAAGRGSAPALYRGPARRRGHRQVLGILADFSGNPVFLETADGQLLYAAGAGSAGADPLQVWRGCAASTRRSRPPGRPSWTCRAAAPAPARYAPGWSSCPSAPRSPPCTGSRRSGPAGILAVVLMQARQEEELAARGRGDFLTDLAEGRIAAEDAPAQARVLGFKPGSGPLLPVVMRLADGPSPGGGWAVLARAVAEELASVGVPVLLGVRPVEGRVPLLLGLAFQSECAAVADRVAAALRAGVGSSARACSGRGHSRPWSWSGSRAAGRRPWWACGTRRRRRWPRRA